MIPFPFNENRFSFFFFFFFFVSDHLLVGQLWTNPKSDRSLLKRDRRCAALQLMLSTDTSYDSQNHRWIATNNSDVPRVMITKFPATVMVFGVVSSDGHIMLPHIFEVGFKVNTKVYLDVLKSVVIPWWNQVAGGRPWVRQQDSAPAHKSKETQVWLQKECYDFVPFSRWPLPRLEPAGLLHQHDLPQHQSQPDRLHLPSIRRAPAGACGKGMLPDPYRGGDWGWRRLHWIDVSSTT